MRTLIGIFRSSATAATAVTQLRMAGFTDDHLLLLTPHSITGLHAGRLPVPHPHGSCGITAGHIVGAISGFAGGALAGAVAIWLMAEGSLFVTMGTIALASLAGVGVGAAAGDAVQKTFDPALSYEDLLVYEDAVRHGGDVLLVFPGDGAKIATAQQIFADLGVEGVEDARGHWWHRLQDDKAAALGMLHEGVTATEVEYLRGFDAALDSRMAELSCEEAITFIHEQERAVYQEEAFRRGYERGQTYREKLLRQGRQDAAEPMPPVVH
ncbi:MAG: hypothetical protein HOP18_10585 [Deltaproteobacteria bacterium]|nr:hypothetical protein [Deltaproteobacteria bacterium]